MINVTKTYLPPIEEYTQYLKEIWSTGWITNNGDLLKKLEFKLKDYLNVPNLIALANGTLALQIAIEALNIKKEVITTPFSYVATLNSIIWQKCKPVFVDIDENTLCINPELIEEAISENTEAIMPVHVYGIPCDMEKIDSIAKKHNLKVIYDAAHAFGVTINNKSILNYGDMSILSFHATKLFHTAEGGAIVTNDDTLSEKIWLMKKFGHKADEYYFNGINAKMSELHAALGLCVLKEIDKIIEKRKEISKKYDEYLRDTTLRFPEFRKDINYNYSYYPVIFPDEKALLVTVEELNKKGIFPRRYFYPSLNTLAYIDGEKCPVAEYISRRVLSLPLSDYLHEKDIEMISLIIIKIL